MGQSIDLNEEADRLVLELMCLAYIVQKTTDYAVFIDYSGHVDKLNVSIRESPTNYNKEIASTDFYVADETARQAAGEPRDPLGWLKSKRKHFMAILETGEVDLGEYEVEEIIERTLIYTF